MSEPWRLRLDPPVAGARNMALDEELLDAVAAGTSPPTLRFYGWSPPCLSLGYFQPPELVDLEACARFHVDVVRRPTGGRAILHDRRLPHHLSPPPAAPGGGQAGGPPPPRP